MLPKKERIRRAVEQLEGPDRVAISCSILVRPADLQEDYQFEDEVLDRWKLESIREFSLVISLIISESYVIFGPLINGLHDGCSQKSQSLQNGFNRWSMGCCGAVGYESGSCESSGSSC